jgi:hypothetical protein
LCCSEVVVAGALAGALCVGGVVAAAFGVALLILEDDVLRCSPKGPPFSVLNSDSFVSDLGYGSD